MTAKKSTAKAADPSGAARAFFAAHPDLKFVDAIFVDLNGVVRGKRMPTKSVMKLFESGARMPFSLVGVDIWGADVADNGLVIDSGDMDGLVRATEKPLARAAWAKAPTAQVQLMMSETDGTPFLADPRQLLSALAARLQKRGLTPVCAVELEFYLLSKDVDDFGRPLTPRSPVTGRRVRDGRVYAMSELDAYAAFFSDLYDVCQAQGLPLDTAVIEAGPSQFEVNLKHQADIVAAADQSIWLRRAVKSVADAHGCIATFMAKPFGELAGNGLHVHMSMLDSKGANVFASADDKGSPTLKSAVAGLIAAAPESMIFFAPHMNSWRRFQEGSHAPTRAAWGYENRTACVRIPGEMGANTRFEHRVSGADANPYLVLAAIIAGVLHGVENRLKAPPPLAGNAYASDAPSLALGWREALAVFERGDIIAPMFGPLFTRVYAALKRQEQRIADRRVTDFEYEAYLQAF